MDTEKSIVIGMTMRMVKESTMSIDSFATTLLFDQLSACEILAADSSVNESEYMQWRNRIRTRVRRICSGEVPFPLEWK